jgi:hypothetical protein
MKYRRHGAAVRSSDVLAARSAPWGNMRLRLPASSRFAAARMKATCFEGRSKAIVGDGNAAFAAFRAHGVKEIADPERHDEYGRRDEHGGEDGEPSRGVAAFFHKSKQPQRRQQEERMPVGCRRMNEHRSSLMQLGLKATDLPCRFNVRPGAQAAINWRAELHGSNTVDPVVSRASRSRCAWAASARG